MIALLVGLALGSSSICALSAANASENVVFGYNHTVIQVSTEHESLTEICGVNRLALARELGKLLSVEGISKVRSRPLEFSSAMSIERVKIYKQPRLIQ